MNLTIILNNIKQYLSNFQNQVEISTDNNEYDINIHAENFLIPIFNIILNGNFENLNYSDKNAIGIDLLDRTSGIAIQVTSTKNLNKIKKSLAKLIRSNYGKDVKKLYIYILTTKQASYSQNAIDTVVGNKITFDVKKNIWDKRDLYKAIQSITDIDIIKNIEILFRKNFSELYFSQTLSQTDYFAFKSKYSKICIDNFSRLNFFGLSIQRKPREVDLNQLFVKPIFFNTNEEFGYIKSIKNTLYPDLFKESLTQNEFSSKEVDIVKYLNVINSTNFRNTNHFTKDLFTHSNVFGEVNFEELFSHNKHIVLLGNPGAGKSSIVKYAICKILEKDYNTFLDKSVFDTLPIRIEIHKYNQNKIDKKFGIIDYISTLLNDEYQLQLSSEDLRQILKHNKTTIFFDGLDEVFDIQQRLSVRNDIQNFIRAFEKVKCVVTSRFESYTEVSLSEKSFLQLEVQNFNNTQIEDYVQKWYSLEENNTEVKKEEVNNCLKQLNHVDEELKCNPLLLSLILILYRNELEIPTSKLEIYENCTTTIVDHRDNKEKKLLFDLTISNPVAIFSDIAYWQFDNQNKELLAEDILLYVKNHLLKKGEIDDDYKASCAAMEFLEFAKVRSIYFENKFTHKTFLEYFTSYYIYSTLYSKPKNHSTLESLITKNISLSSWAVVLELLICKIDSLQIDFEIIDSIVEKQLEGNREQASLFFLTIIRYLKNVSPRIREKIISYGLVICLQTPFDKETDNKDLIESLFNALVSLSKIKRFQESIKKEFKKLVNQGIINVEELYIFAYEFQMCNNEISLIDFLDAEKNNKPSIYLNILKHFNFSPTSAHYLELIIDVRNLTGKFDNLKLEFNSRYGQSIFYGSQHINLLILFICSFDAKELPKAYEILLKEGISFSDLKKIVPKLVPYLTIHSVPNEYSSSSDTEIKKLIKITIDAYEKERFILIHE